MAVRMPRQKRLAQVLNLLEEILPPDRPGAREETEDQAAARLDRVERDVMPQMNEHLRALGARPVDIDKVYRRVAGKTSRPSPAMHLLLLGARIARRVGPIETRFIASRPDGRHLIGEARARLKPSRTIDIDDRIRF